ncbi:ELF3-like protein 2 [Telopea speciosissima]|uniref:ELF3-like protein 2 n=1 Tax=Telopea speciosissima TaxID=54955 RepID=UPI001CC74DC7|nr:ELF3-like protein 2 [Telopea speciosissima]
MKEGKDEEKNMSPLFPRLNVNDTEKRGPRAPPRNKMALYEQVSVPSQRFNSWLASTLPLPPDNTSTVVPSTSTGQGGGNERSVFPPHYVPSPTPTHSTEKLHSYSSDGVNLNASMAVFERKSMKNGNYRTSDATGNMLSTPECNSFQLPNFSNSKNSGQRKLVDEDDVKVPTFIHPEDASCSNKDLPRMEGERLASFCPTNQGRSPMNSPLKPTATTSNLLRQPQNVGDKNSKWSSTTDMRSSQQIQNQSEENLEGSIMSRECAEVPASHQLTRKKVAKPLTYADGFENLEHQSSPLDDIGRVCDTGRYVQQEYRAGLVRGNTAFGDEISVEPVGLEKGNITRVRSEPCSRISPGNSHRNPDQDENGSDYHEDNAHGSLRVGDVDRDDDASETSMVDSTLAFEISSDDVVGVIGQTHFWKARRAIVNQQRVFAVQVFELHRLIKVQRLIAGSPHLLLENNHYLAKLSLMVSPTKKLPSEHVLKPPQQNVEPKADCQKPNCSTECAENAVGEPTVPSLDNDINRGIVSQHSSFGPYSRNPPVVPVVTDSIMGPWCFHPPPGNQWLVPFLSPSEGLVYKPYTGPCPPPPGFMAQVYGGCAPLSLPPVAGKFINSAYGVPATHQGKSILPGTPPVGQTYFPTYGIPVMSSVMSAAAVEQASLGAWLHGQAEQLTGEANFNMHQQRSAVDSGMWKFERSKDSELQGSTASSPSERAPGAGPGHVDERDTLPLFPMAPAVQISDRHPQVHRSDQQIRVIKVAPYNSRSATESVARIFRSIQKERQQYDSV